MDVDRKTVLKVAELARIRLDEDRIEPLAVELTKILDWVEQLESVDTEGVEPMTTAVAAQTPMRPDTVTDGEQPEAVLANAPEAEEGFFAVPKVVE